MIGVIDQYHLEKYTLWGEKRAGESGDDILRASPSAMAQFYFIEHSTNGR